jgi:hypothetical protein
MMVDDEGADDRPKQLIEADTLDAIEGDQARFENTGNPLFAWQALQSWLVLNRARAGSDIASIPMPDWLAGYLLPTSIRMVGLANGRDFAEKSPLTRKPEPAPSQDRQRRGRAPRLTPTEAVRRVPHALGLVRERWNAFRHMRQLNAQETDEISVALYKAAAPRAGDGKAFEMLSEDTGVADERELRRRIAKARKARGVKPSK